MADQTTIDNLYNELMAQYNATDPSLMSDIYGGGVYSSAKSGLGSYEAVFKDMASKLADQGVTSLSDIQQQEVPVMQRVKVSKQMTDGYNDSTWTGNYVDDRGNVYSADQVKQADWTGTGDAGTTTENVVEVPTGQTQKVPVNSLTGESLFTPSWDQNNQEVFNPYFGRTYAGEDGTAYSINFTDQGAPIITSKGFDTSDNDALRTLGMFAATVIPSMYLSGTGALGEGVVNPFEVGGGVDAAINASYPMLSTAGTAAAGAMSVKDMLGLAKAGIGLFGAVDAYGNLTNARTPTGNAIPMQSYGAPSADYYQQVQDIYNTLGVGNVSYPGAATGTYAAGWNVTPRNVATPLQSWYGTSTPTTTTGAGSSGGMLGGTAITPTLDTSRAQAAAVGSPEFSSAVDKNVAYYNDLLNAGWSDAQIRSAAEQKFGPISQNDWTALTGIAGGGMLSDYYPQQQQPLTIDTTQAQTAAVGSPNYQSAVNSNVAYYNNLINQGYNDAQIRAAAAQQFGPVSDATWKTLTDLVG